MSMSMSMSMSLNAVVNSKLETNMKSLIEEVTIEAVRWCGERYNFDTEEALRGLGVEVSLSSMKKTAKSSKKTVIPKSKFVLPYVGLQYEECCSGLRKNGGLYTQCQVQKKVNDKFCKTCQNSADKNDGIPEYGTIEERKAVDIFDYVDPKGRKPISYLKIMKKLNLTQEDVLAEAERLNIVIDERHFEEEEEDVKESKRGRPKLEKAVVAKGAKGRPKKTKKVVEVKDDNEAVDLFASLVSNSFASLVENENSEEYEEVVKKEAGATKRKTDDEREAARLLKQQEKEKKEAARLKEKEEKEAVRLKQKEEKEAKKKADEEAKAQRLKEKEAAREKKSKSKKVKEPEQDAVEDEEPDIVKKIEVDGVKYLKSKKTGLVYDYKEYTQYGVQVVVGEWNVDNNCIDFDASAKYHEEEEEEEEEQQEEQEDE